jgi:hypothetical protein
MGCAAWRGSDAAGTEGLCDHDTSLHRSGGGGSGRAVKLRGCCHKSTGLQRQEFCQFFEGKSTPKAVTKVPLMRCKCFFISYLMYNV